MFCNCGGPGGRLLGGAYSPAPLHRRVRGLRSNDEGEPSAGISRIDGEYLINITIGTPPVAPLFNPRASSTYEQVHCVSDKCHLYDKTFCNTQGFTCQYSAVYGDQSYSEGNISTDIIGLITLTGSPYPFPGMAFGCGFKNDGLFSTHATGVLKGAPSITVHFTGADVVLNWYNAFFEVKEGITCFSFAPTDGLPIYGNLAQMNFRVSYDLTLGEVLFQPTDCAD
ncbi:hypothetical protein MLD38_037351 [Melastoma candidum]|uniref:Uncharacterized protein n=1 Tax=Melastoma candidum TaxID=119954 RepID=A0ACB9LPB9_9MYRT|nr:hypothetical protein MLD38_037351 [Melastoma candidum]